ncbi:MAG: diaminopropionate ammonia-lyase [Pseudomonadota bacterium]
MASRLAHNPFRVENPNYGEAQSAALDWAEAKRACAHLRSWPVYERTPLVNAAALADKLGVGSIWVKNEAERLPLKSFKSLGGAYALAEYLCSAVEQETGARPDHATLFEGALRDVAERFHVTAATDGNHGRSLAWGAQLFGAKATIFLPSGVSDERAQPLLDFGADIVRISGNYEAALAACAARAAQEDWVHLQDTSFGTFTASHKRIMEGYTLLAAEIIEQLPSDVHLTHSFLQVGCGGMASAITATFWNHFGAHAMPAPILVQSVEADPLVQTFETGKRFVHTGAHDTLMVGIACGEIAPLCETLLYPVAHSAITVDDAAAVDVMKGFASGHFGEAPMTVGETGAAGLAALKTACGDADMREALGLTKASQVLVINSEGDTAPDTYRRLLEGPA